MLRGLEWLGLVVIITITLTWIRVVGLMVIITINVTWIRVVGASGNNYN